MGDITMLLNEIFAAQPAYLKAKTYSDGEMHEVWATNKLGRMLSKSANRYPVNIARRPIDAVLDRLQIKEVSVADDPKMTDLLVSKVYKSNQLKLELPDALDLAETYGDSYLMCWPRPGGGSDDVDVFINDPTGMRVIYDPENPRRKLLSGRTWLDSNKRRRVTIWRDGPRVERWIAKQPESSRDAINYAESDFEPFLTDEGNPDSWFEDLGLGLGNPVFHLRTARPYGKPEHKQAYGTQNMLTKEVATMMDATDGYGFPFRYMLTKAGTTGTVATLDDDWDTPDNDDDPRAPTASKADPGTIAKLTDVDSVGQLQPSDIANFLDPIGMTLRLSSVVTNTPLSYFDPSAASASGESKKEHEKPAVNKANRRRDGYDGAIAEALAYSLALAGHPDLVVTITWAPTESVDDAAEVSLARNRQDAGVPFVVAMTQLGYPKDEVERWVSEATPDDEVLEKRVTLLDILAGAAQKLGAAASLGTIDPAVAQQIMARFLTIEAPTVQPPVAA
jgi:hypothetical protein